MALARIYLHYSTTRMDEDRVTRRPWEGSELMAEIQFGKVASGC